MRVHAWCDLLFVFLVIQRSTYFSQFLRAFGLIWKINESSLIGSWQKSSTANTRIYTTWPKKTWGKWADRKFSVSCWHLRCSACCSLVHSSRMAVEIFVSCSYNPTAVSSLRWLLGSMYDNSPIRAVKDVFPEFSWNTFEFSSVIAVTNLANKKLNVSLLYWILNFRCALSILF